MSAARRNVMGAVVGLFAAGIVIAIVEGRGAGLLVFVVLGCVAIAFYSFGKLLSLQLTLHRYRKPGTDWPASYSANPFMIAPDSLTEEGRSNLRKIMKCYFVFAGSILLPFVLNGLLG
jgi:hypothetical protein